MKHTMTFVAVGLALAAALSASSAMAQNVRSFVSPTGSDSNPCTLASPCRNFQAAFNMTNAGGEIAVLGTAGYGTLTITHAISIVNPGAFEAGIAVPSAGIGIAINAGASDAISLRGLTIEGGGIGFDGIQFNSGGSLTIEDSVIRNLTGAGIAFLPNSSSNLLVSNTRVANNDKGIQAYPSGGSYVNITITHVEAVNNITYGVVLNATNFTGFLSGTASDSVATNNGVGFIAIGPSSISSLSNLAVLSLFHVNASNNLQNLTSSSCTGTAIQAQGQGGGVLVAQSMAENNCYQFQALTNGTISTYGDNYGVEYVNSTGSTTSIKKW